MKRIACIQMASGPNVDANLAEAERLIERAAAAGAVLAVLPEHFASMGGDEQKRAIAEVPGDGPIQAFLAERARRHGLWLVGGVVPLRTGSGDRVRAAVLVYDDAGRQVARYDKIHLFDVTVPGSGERYRESALIEPGDTVVVIDSPVGRLGLCVCYDVRFPELFRLQVDQGMEVLAVPSAFTAVTGRAHWQPLLQARAIENQIYVAAADQGGYHLGGRETHGHSMIVDPWGTVLDCLPSGAGVVSAEVDTVRQRALREQFPVLQHRRLRVSGPERA